MARPISTLQFEPPGGRRGPRATARRASLGLGELWDFGECLWSSEDVGEALAQRFGRFGRRDDFQGLKTRWVQRCFCKDGRS